jgi:hypothetical protein
VDDPDTHDPRGIKGPGEVGIVGAAAAIANAVWHATGVRHRNLPIRPDRVLLAGTGHSQADSRRAMRGSATDGPGPLWPHRRSHNVLDRGSPRFGIELSRAMVTRMRAKPGGEVIGVMIGEAQVTAE